MSTPMRVFFLFLFSAGFLEVILFIGFCGRGTNPRRVSAAKTLSGHTRNPAMHLGKRPEQEQDPDSSRTARRHDPGHATTPGSAASSQGRQSRGPATATATRPAGGPAQAGQLTTSATASGPDPPSAPPQATAAPRTRRPATIPAPTAGPPHSPIEPRQLTPRPTPDDSPHAAQDAHRTRQRRPTTIYTHQQQQPATAPASGPNWTASATGPAPATVHELNRERTPDSAHAGVLKKCDNLPLPLAITHACVYNKTIETRKRV